MALQKLKTKKSFRKRMKLTGSGLVKSKHGSIRHRLTSKSSMRNRRSLRSKLVHPTDIKRVQKQILYFLK